MIVRMSEAEARARIEEILDEHPVLNGLPGPECCRGCYLVDLAEEFGWRVADAWAEIDELQWLLEGA